MPKNPIVYWELASHNAEKSVKFFKDVFNWTVKYYEKIGIYEIPVDDPDRFSGGGIFTLKKARLPFLTIYIKVDNLEDMVKKVQLNGGQIVEPPLGIPGGSRICLFNEPSGVTFAMIQYPVAKNRS